MLYDPRMEPGMRQDQALELASEILPGLRRIKPTLRPALPDSP